MSSSLINAQVPHAFLDRKLIDHQPGVHTTTVDIVYEKDKIIEVKPHDKSKEHEGVDIQGQLVLPAFLDSHTHLDKAHSWNRAPNISGTFAEALEVLSNDKTNWTPEDVYRRANFAIKSAYAYGTAAIRTHVDTGLPWAERSYEAIAKLKDEWKGKVEIQMVSLCGVPDYAEAHADAIVDLPIRYGASALGGMPLMSERLPHELDCLFRIASERNIGVDLHVDESMDPNATCLEEVAKAVIRNNFTFPVTCGHCCSLAVMSLERQLEILKLVKDANIQIISLPLCNLYLQDRRTIEPIQTPFFRGITLIKEFQKQGTPIACASDNVRDAFYAYGDLDMLEVLTQSIRIAHLDDSFENAFKVSHQDAARIMQLPELGAIKPGMKTKLVCFDCSSLSELFSRPQIKREVFINNKFEAITLPDFVELNYT